MKPVHVAFILFITLFSLTLISANWDDHKNDKEDIILVLKDSILRHVVLFKFKEGTAPEKIKEIEEAFGVLPSKINEIHGYEWGTNNSPEGLNKGLTHCFFLSFKSEKDRDAYLPHPDHQAFGDLLSPHLEDVTVVDYWAK